MEGLSGRLILACLAAVAAFTLAVSIHAAQTQMHESRYEEARSYCPGAVSCDGDEPRLVDGRYCRPLRVSGAVDTSTAICDIPAG